MDMVLRHVALDCFKLRVVHRKGRLKSELSWVCFHTPRGPENFLIDCTMLSRLPLRRLVEGSLFRTPKESQTPFRLLRSSVWKGIAGFSLESSQYVTLE